ncbi:MAG: hypothetical protein EOL97_16410, partial [Spirochaetia bacterium]|nr:hypothetical protein [Spirochaetia bacterium]
MEKELFNLLVNKKLGTGVYRTVYDLKYNKDKVIKVANDVYGEKENAREYILWDDISNYYPKLKKWFAPCYQYSATGKYLIQDKVIFPDKTKYPKQLPAFFTDTKYSNFGLLNGKWVCIDYGCF